MLYAPEEPDTDTLRVPVLRVFDGDGFLTRIPVRNREFEVAVRLGFIDAPEIGQPGGTEARDFLAQIIGGQWVDLAILMKMDTGGSLDRHGRIVAVPYLRRSSSIFSRVVGKHQRNAYASRNVELEMVLNGWAWVLDRYCPSQRYFDALEDAQRNRRGIWARDDNIHPWDFKKQKYQKTRPRKGVPQYQFDMREPKPQVRCQMEGCDGHLVKRSGKYGDFYGCSEFPKCRYSRTSEMP
jgi:endonuclease YncB( thermonuclease family)